MSKQYSTGAKEALQLINEEFGWDILNEICPQPEEVVDTTVLTKEHLLLLSKSYFNSNNQCEYGALEVDGKRPYGNSDVLSDIYEILGTVNPKTAEQLHFGLHAVVKCIVSNLDKSPQSLIGTDLRQYGLIDYHNKNVFK